MNEVYFPSCKPMVDLDFGLIALCRFWARVNSNFNLWPDFEFNFTLCIHELGQLVKTVCLLSCTRIQSPFPYIIVV